MATHYDIIQLERVASTQDAAAEAFDATGVPTLVVADRQLDGRGRSGRAWLEPDHAMFSSYAFDPDWPSADLPLIPLCAAVAVRAAILSETDRRVDLKWPNDLMLGGRKVGGILVEASDGTVVVGCGVNLAWDTPPPYADALLASPIEADAARSLASTIASRWVEGLRAIVAAGADRWPRSDFVEGCVTVGSRVAWDRGEGVATDVAEDGSLIVETGGGTVAILSGDVHLLGAPPDDDPHAGGRG
jgi:BirA family biotin operon repressor/biotin-[acetyl-CoA-carboxylase] ligase